MTADYHLVFVPIAIFFAIGYVLKPFTYYAPLISLSITGIICITYIIKSIINEPVVEQFEERKTNHKRLEEIRRKYNIDNKTFELIRELKDWICPIIIF